MSGPRLTDASNTGSAADFEAAVARRVKVLRDQGAHDANIWAFPAPISADSVWTFHALKQLGVVALPTPPQCTASLRAAYAAAVDLPTEAHTQLRLLTSGSTGQPSVVDLTTAQLDASVSASQSRLGCDATDRWLCCLPLHHIAGISILWRTAQAGATAVLQPDFEPRAVNRAIDDQGITMISLVPSMLKRVLDDRNGRGFPDNLRVILLGGAPASSALIDECRAIQAPVALTWGMTETASQVATRMPGDLRRDPDVGLPLPGHTVSVEDGYLVVHGPIAPSGRFVTNDRGHLDTEGRVIVVGRGHRFIISGGENVDPIRVESILKEHPNIDDAVVIGVDDERWGQRTEAFLVGDASAHIDDYIRAKCEPHERPKRIHWMRELPRTSLGKIDRGALLREPSR